MSPNLKILHRKEIIAEEIINQIIYRLIFEFHPILDLISINSFSDKVILLVL